MRLEPLLAGIAAAAIVATALLAAFVPGFVADPGGDGPPAELDVEESTLSTGEITGRTATFEVAAFVSHRGGSAENVSLVVRATDEASGVLVDTAERTVGTVEGDGEREIPVSVTVPREGSYRIQAILYVDGQRVDSTEATVSGLEALTPPQAESAIEFHDFFERPSVEYSLRTVGNETATLSTRSYLTNTGDEPESGLRLEVTARQVESNVVADRAETTIGTIEAGRTAPTEVTLTVPDGYNYYLDATLWRDGVVIDSTRTGANLDPQETLDVNESPRPVQFEASDFESDGQSREAQRLQELEEHLEATQEEQPGFGLAAAIVALAACAVATRRWST